MTQARGTQGGAAIGTGIGTGTGPVSTAEEIAYEARGHEGAIWTGGRLLIGIFAFAFASLAFAYFYLRSSNSEDLWRLHGVTAPTGVGTAVMAVTVGTGALIAFGLRRFKGGARVDWDVAGWLSVVGAAVAVGLQIWELTDLPFHPGSSGYASCFVGWAAMNIALLASGLYWIETLMARHLRLRRALIQEGDVLDRTTLVPRIYTVNAEACSYFWGFIAVVAVFFWIFFYVAV